MGEKTLSTVETDETNDIVEIQKGLEDAMNYVPSNLLKAEDKKDGEKDKDDPSGDDGDEGSEEEMMKKLNAMFKKNPDMMKKYMKGKMSIGKAKEGIDDLSASIQSELSKAEDEMVALNDESIRGIFEPFTKIASAVSDLSKAHIEKGESTDERLSAVESELSKAVEVIGLMIPGIKLLVDKHVETVSKGDDITKAKGEGAAKPKSVDGAIEGEKAVSGPADRISKAIDELVVKVGRRDAVSAIFAKANELGLSKDYIADEIAKAVSPLQHYEVEKLKKIPEKYVGKVEEIVKAL